MPAIITKDDIEDALYRAGIREPAIRAKLMKMITAYAWEMKYGTPPPLPGDGYSHLLPGEADLEKEVTRCRECTIVKEWKRYHADKASPSRHKDTCKSCVVKKPAS